MRQQVTNYDTGVSGLSGAHFCFFSSLLPAGILCVSRLSGSSPAPAGSPRQARPGNPTYRLPFDATQGLRLFCRRHQLDGSYRISFSHIQESIQLSASPVRRRKRIRKLTNPPFLKGDAYAFIRISRRAQKRICSSVNSGAILFTIKVKVYLLFVERESTGQVLECFETHHKWFDAHHKWRAKRWGTQAESAARSGDLAGRKKVFARSKLLTQPSTVSGAQGT